MATEEFMDRSLQHAFDAEQVMAYLDGELEPQRAAMLAGHLEHCAECQSVAKQMRLISGRMLNFEIEPMPENVSAAVLAELHRPDRPAPARPRSLGHRMGGKWREVAANRNVWALAGGFAILVAVVVFASPQMLRRAREPGYRNEQILNEPAAPVAPQPGASEERKDAAQSQRSQEAMLSGSMVTATAASQQAAEPAPLPSPQGEPPQQALAPMIVQTASLSIVAKNYDEASEAIGELAKARGGYVEKLDAKAQTGSARALSIALRVPTKQLDGFLADLRKLGHVEQESQSNEEVSALYVDLQARLRSAQATERRLIELLATRTGRLEDVLDVERELARVRAEIESMQGQSNVLLHRVSYATVQVELGEEYHERLQSGASTGTRLRNALIEGVHNLEEGIVGALVFLLNQGPGILFWLAVFGFPGWLVWRRWRSRSIART
jgi:anti-sigma factor RsiW